VGGVSELKSAARAVGGGDGDFDAGHTYSSMSIFSITVVASVGSHFLN
jgi:hypothetical protein